MDININSSTEGICWKAFLDHRWWKVCRPVAQSCSCSRYGCSAVPNETSNRDDVGRRSMKSYLAGASCGLLPCAITNGEIYTPKKH